jgi:hypothetical protein
MYVCRLFENTINFEMLRNDTAHRDEVLKLSINVNFGLKSLLKGYDLIRSYYEVYGVVYNRGLEENMIILELAKKESPEPAVADNKR